MVLYVSAPEIQHKSLGSKSSDLYSLGMLMVALFNGGQSLIQANYSTNLYFKQAGMVSRRKIKETKTLITGIWLTIREKSFYSEGLWSSDIIELYHRNNISYVGFTFERFKQSWFKNRYWIKSVGGK